METKDMPIMGTTVRWEVLGEVEVRALQDALDSIHCDKPAPPSPRVRLTRAFAALRTARLDHSVKTGKRERVAVAGTLVAESDGKRPEYEVGIRADLDEDGDLRILTPGHSDTAKLLEAFTRARVFFESGDVSALLVAHAHALDGVPLGGGWHWIPPEGADSWNRYLGAVLSASNVKVYALTVARSPETVDALISAISEETEATIAAIEAWVESLATKSSPTRTRTYDHKIEQLHEAADKLQTYLRRFDAGHSALEAKLLDVEDAVLTAKLMANPEFVNLAI